MERVIVNIGDKTYKCQVAKNEEDRRKGLQGVENLPIDEGMLFVWEDEATREMWMKDTKIPLDQIAINDDDEVVLVYTAQPEDETLVPFMNAKYILEVNANSGIVEGDEFEIDDTDDLAAAVIAAINGYSKNYGPNQDLSKEADVATPDVSWRWEYEKDTLTFQNDENDTALSDEAATGTAATLELIVKTTISQID